MRGSFKQRLTQYKGSPVSFILYLMVSLSALATVSVLIFILGYIIIKGIPYLNPGLFSLHYTSENVSLVPAFINTIIMTVLALCVSGPIGISSAIYLVEYAKKGNKFVEIVRITSETLSGIPSIVYGLFGMLFFVGALGLGYSILSGALTLSIMILPLIMRTTEEALKTVPDSFREGSFGLGAGKLRTIIKIVLPTAMPGILSGIILSIGRIAGESAALIYTAGTVASLPKNIFSSGRTLSVHMYALSSEGLFMNEAHATAVVLVVLVAVINFLSSLIAKKFSSMERN